MKFSPTTIKKDDDGFFLIDSATGMLSTNMMAVSPRHPIMYYAVQHLLLDILMEESSSSFSSSFSSSVGTAAIIHNNTINNKKYSSNAITGSFILSRAFRTFQEGQEKGDNGNLSPGVFHGVMNRTIRVVAGGGLNININNNNSSNEYDNDKNNNNLVMSIFSSEQEKETEYQKMGVMVLAEEDNSSDGKDEVPSCLDGLYHHRTGVSVSF